MNPKPYIHAFAGIAITALCMRIIGDFWLPLLLGAIAAVVLGRLMSR
jgi:predicted PurR-regulated permease PerM